MRMAPHPPFYQPGRLRPRSGNSSLRCAYQMKAEPPPRGAAMLPAAGGTEERRYSEVVQRLRYSSTGGNGRCGAFLIDPTPAIVRTAFTDLPETSATHTACNIGRNPRPNV